MMSKILVKNSISSTSTHRNKLKTWKEIPGPATLPILGQLHNFFPGGTLYKYEGNAMWKRLFDEYGNIVRLESILRPTSLVLFDPDCMAKILHSENYTPKREAFFTLKHFRKEYNKTKEDRSAGLVIENGEIWRDMRLKVNPVLMMPNIVKMYTNPIDEVALDMVERIKLRRDSNNMIRDTFDKEINLWSLESVGVIGLGRRLNCLNVCLEQNSSAKTLIECTHNLFEIAHALDFQPSIWKYYATASYKNAMKIYTDLESVTKEYINKTIKEIKAGKHENKNEKSVLEKLLEIDEDTAHVMVTDMLIAGVDTTSITMLSVLYCLAKNPEKQKILRNEITTQKERPYLKACIKESLRLMPTVGLNFRITTKEYNIMGYKIPKNMGIIFNHHILGLMDRHFPQAKEFIPERWLVPKDHPLHYRNTHPFIYQPFGFGVRSCIGRRIAELETETLLARLIENFELDWVGPPPEIIFSFLNYMKGPYNFVFKDVNK